MDDLEQQLGTRRQQCDVAMFVEDDNISPRGRAGASAIALLRAPPLAADQLGCSREREC